MCSSCTHMAPLGRDTPRAWSAPQLSRLLVQTDGSAEADHIGLPAVICMISLSYIYIAYMWPVILLPSHCAVVTTVYCWGSVLSHQSLRGHVHPPTPNHRQKHPTRTLIRKKPRTVPPPRDPSAPPPAGSTWRAVVALCWGCLTPSKTRLLGLSSHRRGCTRGGGAAGGGAAFLAGCAATRRGGPSARFCVGALRLAVEFSGCVWWRVRCGVSSGSLAAFLGRLRRGTICGVAATVCCNLRRCCYSLLKFASLLLQSVAICVVAATVCCAALPFCWRCYSLLCGVSLRFCVVNAKKRPWARGGVSAEVAVGARGVVSLLVVAAWRISSCRVVASCRDVSRRGLP